MLTTQISSANPNQPWPPLELETHSLPSPIASKPRAHLVLLCENQELRSQVTQIFKPEMQVSLLSQISEGPGASNFVRPDVILCEHTLSTSAFLKNHSEGPLKTVPVLILVREPDRSKASSFFKPGQVDCLSLPLDPAEARARVETYTQYHRAHSTLIAALKGEFASLEHLAEKSIQRTHEVERNCRRKDEFIAMLSHELRNPINVISGFAEVLLNNADDSLLAQEAAETIYRNAQYQSKLIQDLMDVSCSLNGKMILDCTPMELSAVIREIWTAAHKAAVKKNIQIVFRPKSAGWVFGDFTRLTQVIWNLVSNAIKFTPENGKVEIEIQNIDNFVELSVHDTGVGIEPQFLPQLFEQFHQQDISITKRFGGLGLGLAIVKSIVELHKGSVRASSPGPNLGATFVIQIPALPN